MKKNPLFPLLGVAIIALSLYGCGQSEGIVDNGYVDGGAGSYAAKSSAFPQSEPSYDAAEDSYAMTEEAADYDYEADTREAQPIEVDERAATDDSPKLDREKIVYTGSISTETMEWDKSIAAIKKLISDNDGIIQSENEYYNNSDWYYETQEKVRTIRISARIPSKNFNKVLEGAGGIGQMTEKTMNASNITREYYDVQARLKTKQTELERFTSILEKADKVKDILEIEDRISDVQYEIDSAKAQLENMNLDVAYSTIDISVTEVMKYSSDPKEATSKLQETITGAWHFFMSFLWGLFRFILYAGPCAVVIGFILWCLGKLFRKFHKPKPGKKRGLPFFKKKNKEAAANDEENNQANNTDDNTAIPQ